MQPAPEAIKKLHWNNLWGDGMFDLFGKKEVAPKTIFSIQTEFHPYSLKPNKSDYLDLDVVLTNNSGSEVLASLVAVVPKGLGFERSAISREKEVRLGYLPNGVPKHLKIQVWASERTERGVYAIKIFAVSHYKDYAHVLNEASKKIDLRVE